MNPALSDIPLAFAMFLAGLSILGWVLDRLRNDWRYRDDRNSDVSAWLTANWPRLLIVAGAGASAKGLTSWGGFRGGPSEQTLFVLGVMAIAVGLVSLRRSTD